MIVLIAGTVIGHKAEGVVHYRPILGSRRGLIAEVVLGDLVLVADSELHGIEQAFGLNLNDDPGSTLVRRMLVF